MYPCGLRNAHAQWRLDLISRCNGETVKTWKVEFSVENVKLLGTKSLYQEVSHYANVLYCGC